MSNRNKCHARNWNSTWKMCWRKPDFQRKLQFLVLSFYSSFRFLLLPFISFFFQFIFFLLYLFNILLWAGSGKITKFTAIYHFKHTTRGKDNIYWAQRQSIMMINQNDSIFFCKKNKHKNRKMMKKKSRKSNKEWTKQNKS